MCATYLYDAATYRGPFRKEGSFMAVDYGKIGMMIKTYRTEKNMSQEELAKMLYVSANHISYIETAARKPSLDMIVAIANALEVSADDLLIGSLDHTSSTVGKELHAVFSDCNHDEMEMLTRTLQFLKALFTEFGI